MKFRSLLLAAAVLSLAPALPSCVCQQIVTRQEDGMAKLNSALTKVQDKASADAAALAVSKYGTLLRRDMGTLLANGRPSLIQLALLKKTYQNSNIRLETKNALGEFFRIYGQGYYGSTTLRKAFIDMLRAAPTPEG